MFEEAYLLDFKDGYDDAISDAIKCLNNLFSDNDESIWNIGFQLDQFIRCADVEYDSDEKRLIIESHDVADLYDS